MQYPLTTFHFNVEWNGSRIGFSEVSGLDMSVEPIRYREGSSPSFNPIVMPGIPSFSNVVLKRGVFAGDNDFFTWINTISLNQVERRDLTISLLNEEHNPVMRWKIKNAWPVKLQGPTLNATANEVAIEMLELAHEGVQIENG